MRGRLWPNPHAVLTRLCELKTFGTFAKWPLFAAACNTLLLSLDLVDVPERPLWMSQAAG
eukprot:4027217-Karenia_brevis.AAC.1